MPPPSAFDWSFRFPRLTVGEIGTLLDKACDAANHRARARLVFPGDVDARRVVEAPQGVQRADGGGVSRAYVAEWSARCSRLGIGWWRDRNGERCVRVVADRDYLNSQGDPLPIEADLRSGWAFCFPDRSRRRRDLHAAFCRRVVASMGPPAEADRPRIGPEAGRLACRAPDGLLIVDRFRRPRLCELVVTDATLGTRHHIGVPTRFADPDTETYRRLGTDAARVHAAAAWTFGLSPAEYRPLVEA